jgi:hypothetical protein
VNTETKEQSMQWMHTHSPNKPKRFEQKLMATVFCDRKGMLIVEFVQQGTIITSEMYCETLKKNCVGPFRTKARNADIQCSSITIPVRIQLLALQHFNWELFDHPPYSLNLAPSD